VGKRKWNVEINSETIDLATQVKQEICIYEDRIKKMDELKETVRDSVYSKVKKDYEKTFKQLKNDFDTHRRKLLKEVAAILKDKNTCERELANLDEKMEELKFRQ